MFHNGTGWVECCPTCGKPLYDPMRDQLPTFKAMRDSLPALNCLNGHCNPETCAHRTEWFCIWRRLQLGASDAK